jgi:hypothetical protein
MNHCSPIILATIAGCCESERLQLVMTPLSEGGSHLELRQQSYAAALGWYTQSSVQIEPDQVAELRNSLGIGGPSGKIRTGAASRPSPLPLRIVG